MASVVLGIGSYLPKKCLSNDDLSEFLDTSDSWIVQRAGIRRRYIAADNEHTSDLATHAARAAIENSGVSPQSIDLIVLATATPDNTFPSTAVSVQAHLGITGGAAFDIQAVCSGFIFALATADSFLRAGMARRALVIGAETFSRILDWKDRSTCVLFGDGAGAVVLEYQQDEQKNARQEERKARGILSCHLRSDGRHKSLLYVDGGPSTTGKSGYVRMNGREIFKFAVGKISGVVDDAFSANNIGPDDLNWFVPHQANRRIITASAKKLAIPLEKTIITVDAHANTSAASIPLALDVGVQDGRIQPGHLILLEALGGGLTWGSALLRW